MRQRAHDALLRAWLFLGAICAALAMAGFFYVLLGAGWRPGDPTGKAEPLHHAYQQATTRRATRTRRPWRLRSNPQRHVAAPGGMDRPVVRV